MPSYLRKRMSSWGQTYYQTVYYDAPTVLRRKGRMLAFSFEYNETVVVALKKAVPKPARRWNEDGGHWLINPAYAPRVIDLVKEVLKEDIEVREET